MLAAALVTGTAACGGSARTAGAPVLTVVTGLAPLALAAEAIGQDNVRVVDPVPAGTDPRTWTPTARQAATIRTAAVVLEAGGGFQPGFEHAAAANPGTLAVVGRVAPERADVWLDPYLMEPVGRMIFAALDRRNPAAAATYRNGLDNYEAELSSLDIDYQSTLSDCPVQTLLTVDDAFAVLSARYPVRIDPLLGTVAPIGLPGPATVTAEVAAIRRSGSGNLYTESWVPQSFTFAAVARTGIRVAGTFDTLLGPPQQGWPPAADSYSQLMETNLTAISKALSCPTSTT